MTSSHQGHQIAEAFWRRLWLKELHLSSGLFVSIRGSSLLTIVRFSSNDPHGRAGARLTIYSGEPEGNVRGRQQAPCLEFSGAGC